jgi:hypothetical protein
MPGVEPLAYHVVPRGGGWAVSHEGRYFDHPTLTAATGAAVRAAAISAAYGRAVHVLSRGPRGGWMLIWDSESDVRPPAQFETCPRIAAMGAAETN